VAGSLLFSIELIPHTDIIECMATSDNVVRAGLTPKLRDVPTLISMLTYEAGPASSQLLKPTPFTPDSNTSLLYDPPIDEFSVIKIKLENGVKDEHRKVDGPSLCVITEGAGRLGVKGEEGQEVEVKRGEVLFLGKGVEFVWEGGEAGLEVFRAFVEA
jgi:mannose-6-phosphate isomerase